MWNSTLSYLSGNVSKSVFVYACVFAPCLALGQQYLHPWQINFLEWYKRPTLDVLLKHMSEVEAMRFLHDVVDVSQLEDKLKQNFPGDGDKVVEEVHLLCARVFGCRVGRGRVYI